MGFMGYNINKGSFFSKVGLEMSVRLQKSRLHPVTVPMTAAISLPSWGSCFTLPENLAGERGKEQITDNKYQR
jgi:hypothetical protein